MKDLDTWQREVAAGIAQAHPLEKVRFKSEEVKAPKLVYLMGADVRFCANDSPDATSQQGERA